MGARFSLSDKQIRDLIEATPVGYVPQVTLTFVRDETKEKGKEPRVNPADLVNMGD